MGSGTENEALDFLETMADIDEEKGRDYEEAVREKARSLGRGVPMLPSDIHSEKKDLKQQR